VDEGLRSVGVTAVTVADLTNNGLPSPLPYTPFPGYGEWSWDACTAGLAQWDASSAGQRQALDSAVLEAVEERAAWMRLANKTAGSGVVGFLHE
jgi:hypothetical protein